MWRDGQIYCPLSHPGPRSPTQPDIACDMDLPAIPVNTPYHLDLDEDELFPPFAGLPNEQTGDVSEAVLAGAPWYFICEIGEWGFTVHSASDQI
jgi:hypothetical protein